MGATPTTKKSGILLAVSGDFNDGDYIDGFWTLDHEDIKLVIWLLQHYDYLTAPTVYTVGFRIRRRRIPSIEMVGKRKHDFT